MTDAEAIVLARSTPDPMQPEHIYRKALESIESFLAIDGTAGRMREIAWTALRRAQEPERVCPGCDVVNAAGWVQCRNCNYFQGCVERRCNLCLRIVVEKPGEPKPCWGCGAAA